MSLGLSESVTSAGIISGEQGQITAEAIRRALSQAQTRRFEEACTTAEQALEQGGEPVALNALLGMLRCQTGEFDRALDHLYLAHEARPADALIASNLISALMELGRHDEALIVASPELAAIDESLRVARLRAILAQSTGDLLAAVEAYELVVAREPEDWEAWNNLGNSRTLAADVEGAIAALARAAELNHDAIPIRLNLARALRYAGRFDEAEQELRSIADEHSDDTEALANLHDLLKQRGGSDEDVLDVLERAVARDPGNVELLLGLARQQFIMLQTDQTENTFRVVLSHDPTNTEAFIGLAMLYEHSRPTALPVLVEQAERYSIEANALNLLRAFAHRRAKRYSEGLAAIEAVPKDFEPTRREDILGQFYDTLGDYDAAFAAFTRMNEAQAQDSSLPLLRSGDLRSHIRERLEKTTAEWIGDWVTPPIAPHRPPPVFLLGFPRSGTTLLDTMLMGHPNVVVMEERPALSRVGTKLGGFDAIPQLTEAQVREAQKQYFEEVSNYVDVPDTALLVDKVPLHLNGAAMIYRLFPNAKFVLAMRHPADVVLSCFVSNFRLNPSMSNFVRLDTAAEFYDLTFRNWENSRRLLPLQVHTTQYEELVDNTEEELRKVALFLELDWHDEVLDHQRTAANRGLITTASYAQVTEPVYHRSVGRWRNYRKHLEPILPILRPWVERFGYSL